MTARDGSVTMVNSNFMRMRATRQALAVMAVATALCADRALAAAPAARTHVAEMAGRLVMRIARRFRRVVAAVSERETRWCGIMPVRRRALMPVPVYAAPRKISPFQFRLPPPRN